MEAGSLFHQLVCSLATGQPVSEEIRAGLEFNYGVAEAAANEAIAILKAAGSTDPYLETWFEKGYPPLGKLVGRLDVYYPEDRLVIDWKFGSGKAGVDRLQAAVYACLIGTPITVQVWTFVISRKNWKVAEIEVQQDEIDYTEQKIIKPTLALIKAIEGGLSMPSNPAACADCIYLSCTARRSNETANNRQPGAEPDLSA
jgi:hypothetical protein